MRKGWPYGLLALASRRPYTAALVHRAAGCLPVATTDPETTEREKGLARSSLDKLVVLDPSALVIGSYLRTLWPTLRGGFARIQLPRPAQLDIVRALDDFQAPTSGSIFFGPARQAIRGQSSDPVVQDRLRYHGEWLVNQAEDLVVADWPRLVSLGSALESTGLPWLSPLDMAKTREVPLWCDDLGVRALAASDGVQTFGTIALIAALTEDGTLDPGAAQSALRKLRQEYVVDLPLDADWLRLSAASEAWQPGPSAFYFTRPASWASFEQAYALWTELAQAAAAVEPIRVAGWVQAAAFGVCEAVEPSKASAVLSILAARGIAAASFDGGALGACAALVREVALAAGISNPVPSLFATLLKFLNESLGPGAAAQLLTSSDLAEPDRVVMRNLVFGLGSRPSPLDP